MQHADNAELAGFLAKLWPHREHEAGPVRGLCCRLGLYRWRALDHRWRALDLTDLAAGKEVRYCFWCSKVRIDGQIYEA